MERKIVVRAYYRERPLIGYIRISQISGFKPIQYQLNIYREDKGSLETQQTFFSNSTSAIAHASLYGFSTHKWTIDEKTVPG